MVENDFLCLFSWVGLLVELLKSGWGCQCHCIIVFLVLSFGGCVDNLHFLNKIILILQIQNMEAEEIFHYKP